MAQKSSRNVSRKQEQSTAQELRGRTTPASGALWHSKADVRSDVFLCECKTTKKTFYTLTLNTWNKLVEQARRDGFRLPVMRIDVAGEHGECVSFAVVNSGDMQSHLPELAAYAEQRRPSCEYVKKSVRIHSCRIHSWYHYSIVNFCFGDRVQRLYIIPWKEFLYYASQKI